MLIIGIAIGLVAGAIFSKPILEGLKKIIDKIKNKKD